MKRQEQEMKTEKKQFEFSDVKHSSFTLNKDFKKNRGLRELSFHVKEIIQRDGNSSYKRVADALIKTQRVRGRCEVANVRRRVYDALNVLISVGLIQKEKQSKSLLSTQDNTSRGKCLYRDRWKRLKEMKKDRELIMQSIQIKKKYIKQTAASICKMDALVKKNGYNIDLTQEKEMIQKGDQQIAIPFSQQSYQDVQQLQENRLQFPILMFWNNLSQVFQYQNNNKKNQMNWLVKQRSKVLKMRSKCQFKIYSEMNILTEQSDIKSRRIDQTYELSNQILGQGSFAQVFLGRKKSSGEQVAVKVLSKQSQLSKSEIEILRKIQNFPHLNIVRVIDILEQGTQVYVVYEFCNSQTLYEQIIQKQIISDDQCIDILDQITQGLDQLHKIGIVHRDIKPENILRHIQQGINTYKLTDFGLSSQKNYLQTTKIGTAYYVAPEVVDGRAYDHTVDIWALGLVFDELLHGSPFYNGITEEEVFLKIRNERYFIRRTELQQPVTQKQLLINAILYNLIVRDPNSRKQVQWLLDIVKQYKALNYVQQPVQDMMRGNTSQNWSNYTQQIPLQNPQVVQQPIPQIIPSQQIQYNVVAQQQVQICQKHKKEALYRMPFRTQGQAFGLVIAACIDCLQTQGIYEFRILEKRVEEAIRILRNQADRFYKIDELYSHIEIMKSELFIFDFFIIDDKIINHQYDQVIKEYQMLTQELLKQRLLQLEKFKENNYSTVEESWISNIRQHQDNENDFIIYIKEEIEEQIETATDRIKQYMDDLRQQALKYLQTIEDE